MSNFIYNNGTKFVPAAWVQRDDIQLDPPEHIAGALQWVNMIRGEFCLPALPCLPRGEPGRVRHCPLARALREIGEVEVTGGQAVLQYKKRTVAFTLPRDAVAFAVCFDQRLLPELIYQRGAL